METLKNNLPIISLSLLILGSINLYLYYTYFDIDILTYLDFTEVLQIEFKLFSISASILIGFVIFVSALSYLSTRRNPHELNIIQTIQREKEKQELFQSKNLLLPEEERNYKEIKARKKFNEERIKKMEKFYNKRLTRFDRYRLEILGFPIFILFNSLLLSKKIPQQIMYYVYIWSIPVFVILIIITYLSLRNDFILNPTEKEPLQARRNFYKILGFFIALAYAGGSYARASAISVIIRSSMNEVTVIREKGIFSTNENYRYIGKTKNYLFFYNRTRKQADIIPTSDVKGMSIRDGIDYNIVKANHSNATKPRL